jgi:hypothetical protein
MSNQIICCVNEMSYLFLVGCIIYFKYVFHIYLIIRSFLNRNVGFGTLSVTGRIGGIIAMQIVYLVSIV